jgi:hypothetical protein
VIFTRRNTTPAELFTMTVWLEAPACPAIAVEEAATPSNSKSWNVTPFVRPLIWTTMPVAVGDIFVGVPALYTHVVQSKPPYTVVPSLGVPPVTASGCGSAVNVPHA